MEAKLLVLNGKHKDREIPLPRSVFLIGRDTRCHLRMHSNLASRRHCAIACLPGKVAVRDLKSANGTFVNDQRISGEVKVRDGDRLQIGPLVLLFCIKYAPQEAGQEPISPSSLRWLVEHSREARNRDVDGSTELDLISGHPAPAGGQAPDNSPGTAFSPGEFFFKTIAKSNKPGHLPPTVPFHRIPPAGEAQTGS
jgi:predicted component of type VI protein secretion system